MKKKFKLNNELGGYPVGTILDLDVTKEGVPVAKFWSDRYADSKIDNCIELYKESKPENVISKKKKTD